MIFLVVKSKILIPAVSTCFGQRKDSITLNTVDHKGYLFRNPGMMQSVLINEVQAFFGVPTYC